MSDLFELVGKFQTKLPEMITIWCHKSCILMGQESNTVQESEKRKLVENEEGLHVATQTVYIGVRLGSSATIDPVM